MFSVYVDGKILFATGSEADSPHGLINARLSIELGKSGTFTATVPRTNDLFGEIVLLKSQVEIKLRKNTVWVGSVQFIDNDWHGTTITCLGIMAYLSDTIFSPQSELQGLHSLFKKAIEEHNDMADAEKEMTAGTITVADTNIEFDGSYVTTLDLLTGLVDTYGGYLVPQYTSGGNYLNWIREVEDKVEGEININNLVEFNQSIDGQEIKTILRPIGKNDTGVGGIYVSNDIAIELFGKKYGVVEFPDIEDDAELQEKTEEYLEDLMWASMSFHGKTPELFHVMNRTSEIPVGKLIRVNVKDYEIGHDFAIMGMEIDLNRPADCTASLAANSIWTQISNGKESQSVIRTTGKIKSASADTLTSKTLSTNSSGTSVGNGFSGTVEFSDNTRMNFRNGILIDGVSTEGTF